MDDREAREQVARIDALLEDVEGFADPGARDTATELVGALLDLYGEGVARLAARVADPAALADDELISHLLILHGIHPVPVAERVREALAEVRPYLDSHGGDVELVAVEEGVVRLRMEGSCSGCPSSAATLELAIEDAIRKHAPEVERIEAEDAAAQPAAPALVQLAPLRPAAANGDERQESWTTVGALPQLRGGGTVLRRIAGEPLLFCALDGTFYAYHADCAGCGESLADAELRGSVLACRCGREFDVTRAGRSTDGSGRQLEPVPLLTDDAGIVRVAVATPA